MSRFLTIITMTFLTLLVPSARGQECLGDLFPITEAHLLEPGDRWPERIELEDSTRTSVLTTLGFVDTTGAPFDRIDGYEVFRCEGAYGIDLVAYYLNGHQDEHDDYVYLVTQRDGSMVDKMLVAQLQTSCSVTYLRASALRDDRAIMIQQLEHQFNCETQEFVETTVLPSFGMEIRSDGTFNEVELESE